jgi:thiamine kinase-like enzyme
LKTLPTVKTEDLRGTIESWVSSSNGVSRRIRQLARRQSSASSSCALEELQVQLDDGTRGQLVFKNMDPRAMLQSARQARPRFAYNPRREIEIYRTILMPHHLSTPVCYDAVVKPHLGLYWLFMERVAGLRLDQIGEITIWQKAARWLAHLHRYFASRTMSLARSSHLIDYDRAWYRKWIQRAELLMARTESEPDFAKLVECYDQVIDRICALPTTFIHGEFYASNVLVQRTDDDVRICPVDWELAGVGPGLIDLAALTSGKWSDSERMLIAHDYYAAINRVTNWFSNWDDFVKALDYSRLHIAVQWLGWSSHWSPPPEHAHDWLTEALNSGEKLKLWNRK